MLEAAIGHALADMLKRRPFVPLEVVVADGRVVKINTSEQAWLAFDLELLYVVRMKPADEPLTEIIALRHVSMVRVPERLTPETESENPF